MTERHESRAGWVARRQEKKRLKRERTGDSPDKAAERHTPKEGVIGMMLRVGAIEHESRFKK